MALSVAVNLSAYPEDIPLGIVGIGAGTNGGTIEVDPSLEPVFYQVNGDTIENRLADQEELTVSGTAEWTPPEDTVESESNAPAQTPSAPDSTPPPDTTPSTQESGLPPGTGGGE